MHCNNGLNNKLVVSLVENKVAEETGDLKYLQDSMYDFVSTLKEIILGEYSPEFFNRYVDEALKLHGSNLEEFLKIPKMGLELKQALNSIDEAIDISNQEFRDNLVLLLDRFQTTLDNMEYEARSPYDAAVKHGFIGTEEEWLADILSDTKLLNNLRNGANTLADYIDTIPSAVNDAINNTVISSGFVIIDSFEVGATITQRNQALRHAATGNLYRWAGDLPKDVPIESTPNTSGGMGINAWLEVSDTVLRQELISLGGVSKVKGAALTVSSYSELLSISESTLNQINNAVVAGIPYVYDAALSSWKPDGEMIFSSDAYASIAETITEAKKYNDVLSKTVVIKLPNMISTAIPITNLKNTRLLISGDADVIASFDDLFTFTGCENIDAEIKSNINCGDTVKLGINIVSCIDVNLSKFTIRNLKHETGAAVGVRFNNSVNCKAKSFKIENVSGLVARGVYNGTPTLPSFNCSIEDYELINIVGLGINSGTVGTVDGDGLHVQQSAPANFRAIRGSIKDCNWRFIKAEAPGVYVEDLVVTDELDVDKVSVITAFYGDCHFEGIRGDVTRFTHVLEQQNIAVVAKNKPTWRDIEINATGKSESQTSQYLFRMSIVTNLIDGGNFSNVVLSGDDNYNRGFSATTPNATNINMSDCEFLAGETGEAAVSGISLNNSKIKDSTFSKVNIGGSNSLFRGNTCLTSLRISGNNNIIEANFVDTMRAGSSQFLVDTTATDNHIANNRIYNFDSTTATVSGIAIRLGALRNKIVNNFYDKKSYDGSKSVNIVDLSAEGDNTIIDFIQPVP